MRLAVALLLLAAMPASAQSRADAAEAEGRFVRALTAVAIEDFETARRSLDAVLEAAPGDVTVLTLRAEVATEAAHAATTGHCVFGGGTGLFKLLGDLFVVEKLSLVTNKFFVRKLKDIFCEPPFTKEAFRN